MMLWQYRVDSYYQNQHDSSEESNNLLTPKPQLLTSAAAKIIIFNINRQCWKYLSCATTDLALTLNITLWAFMFTEIFKMWKSLKNAHNTFWKPTLLLQETTSAIRHSHNFVLWDSTTNSDYQEICLSVLKNIQSEIPVRSSTTAD